MPKQFPDVNSTYGAPMGRWTSARDAHPAGPCRLFRVRLDSGGYDDGGAYWGIDRPGFGEPLYCATDEENFRRFTRAADRRSAETYFESKFPGIIFLRKS